MIAPVAVKLKELKAEWDEIEELIDYCSDLYDKIVELVPEEEEIEDIDDDDYTEEELTDIFDKGKFPKSKEPEEDDTWGKVNEYMSGKHEPPIVAPVYDPNIVTEDDEAIISNYYKEEAKKEQYIPFVEEEKKEEKSRTIQSKGSIL